MEPGNRTRPPQWASPRGISKGAKSNFLAWMADIRLFGESSGSDGEDDPALVVLRSQAEAKRAAARAAVPADAGRRTVAEARQLYLLNKSLREEVEVQEAVLSPEECATLVEAVCAAAEANGGWFSKRHERHPTVVSSAQWLWVGCMGYVAQRND